MEFFSIPVIALLVFLLIFAAVGIITWCSTREASFDDVYNQNKIIFEPTPKVKKGSIKKEKPKVKKPVKSVKKAPAPVTKKKPSASPVKTTTNEKKRNDKSSESSSPDEGDHKMVQYELDPIVINNEAPTVADMQPHQLRHRKKKKTPQPQKSILLNKDESPLVMAEADMVSVKEELSPTKVPLDDVELRHFKERRDSEFSLKSQEVAVEEVAKEQKETPKPKQEKPAQDSNKKQAGKKEKKEKKKDGKTAVAGDSNVTQKTNKAAAGGAVEVQEPPVVAVREEKLQQTAAQNTTKSPKHETAHKQESTPKQESVSNLQKQLVEKDNLIAKERSAQQAITQQLEMTHQQLLVQQQQSDMLDKQLQAKAGENQALLQRLHQTHEQHLAEIGSLRQQAERGGQAEEELHRVQQELHDIKAMYDMELKKEKESVHTKTQMLVEQLSQATLKINTLEDGKQLLEKRLVRASEDLKAKENQQRGNDSMAKKVKELGDELRNKEQEITRLHGSIKKLETSQAAAEKKANEAQNQEKGVKNQQQQLQNQLKDLEDKKKKSEADAKAALEQQEVLKSEMEKLKTEHQTALAQAQQPIQQEAKQQNAQGDGITKELEEKTKQVASLSSDLEAQKKKNNTLEGHLEDSKKQVASSQKQAEETSTALAALQKEHNSKLEELKQVLQQKQEMEKAADQLNETAQRSSGLWDQVQQLQKDLADRDAAITKHKTDSEQQGQTIQKLRDSLKDLQVLENKCDELNGSLSQMQSLVKSKDDEIASLNETSARLKSQYESLEKQKEQLVDQQIGQEEELQKEVDRVQTELANKSSSYDMVCSELEQLRQTNSDLQGKLLSDTKELSEELLKKHKEEVEELRRDVSDKSAKCNVLEEQVQQNLATIAALESRQQLTVKEMGEAAEQLTQLRSQLESATSQELQNNSLLEECQQLKQEKEVLQKSIAEQISKAKDETSGQYQALLQRLHPEVSVNESSSEKEWIYSYEKEAVHHFTKEVVTVPADTSAYDAKLQQSSAEIQKLQEQNQNYHKVLSDTESILNKLQSSVNSEEQKWKEKLRLKDEQLIKAQEEVNRLNDQLRNVQDNQEMEHRVTELEGKLKVEQEEKTSFTAELQELAQMKAQLKEKEDKLKELSAQNVKLNAQLRFGQDALKAEQTLVTDLQEELAKKSLANGTNALNEVEELKAKLIAMQKQLDLEAQSNKQLTQRLVPTPESKQTEDGTSV